MSNSLQKKVMDHLEKTATEAGLDFVDQKDSGNTGCVFLQDGFKTVLSFCYHFNDTTIDIQWYPAGVVTKRSPGFLKDTRCILNITSDINSLPSAIESCENIINSVSVPKKTENTVAEKQES